MYAEGIRGETSCVQAGILANACTMKKEGKCDFMQWEKEQEQCQQEKWSMEYLCDTFRKNNYIDPETCERLGVKRGLRNPDAVSYTHLTLPTIIRECRSRWSPYH